MCRKAFIVQSPQCKNVLKLTTSKKYAKRQIVLVVSERHYM